MGKYISLGQYNKNYKYFLLSLAFRVLNECIYGLQYRDLYKDISFFGDEAKIFFNKHEMINTIFNYFAIIIISLILIIYYSHTKNKKHFNENIDEFENSIILIFNKPENFLNYCHSKIFLNIFMIVFLWVISDLLEVLIPNGFWSLKMTFIYFIGKNMFNIQVYKHQIFAIYFISIVCTLLLFISYILYFIKINNKEIGILFICFLILFYFFNLLIDSFSDWKAKWIIDLRFISSIKLSFIYGILGFITSSIIFTIITFISYEVDHNKNDKYKLDNFIIYFNELTKTNCILMILYSITYALEFIFTVLTIEHLTPFHVIAMPTFYLFFIHIVLAINTLIRDKDIFKENMVYIILDVMACLFGLIAYSIFLEFIELNFCLCNYNLRRYIIQRCNNEIYNYNRNESIFSEENREEDKKE